MIRKLLILILCGAAGVTLTVGLLTSDKHVPSAASRTFLGVSPGLTFEYSMAEPRWSFGVAQGFFWLAYTKEVEARGVSRRFTDYQVFAQDTFIARQTPHLDVGEERVSGIHVIVPGLLTNKLRWTYGQATVWRVSLWALSVVCAIYPILAFIRGPVRRWRRRKRGLCRSCGYNLTGLIEARCPECGLAFSDGSASA